MDDDLLVYVQNVGEGVVELDPDNCLYVNGALVPCTIDPTDGLIAEGDTATLVAEGEAAGPGQKVTVKVTTLMGTFTEKSVYPASTTGGPPPPTPEVTRLQAKIEGIALTGTGDGSLSFDSAPTEGNLLVVTAGHRQGNPGTYNTPTIAGYTLDGVEYYYTSSADRRIVAIFSKVAGPGESSTVTIDWNDPVPTFTAGYMSLQEFTGATNYSPVSVDGDSAGGSTGPTTIDVPAAPMSGYDNTLSIAAMSWRGSLSALSFTDLGGKLELLSGTSGTINAATAFSYTTGGTAVTQTTVTWTTLRPVSGLLALYSCS